MKIKNKGKLKKMWRSESWDVLAVWPNGSWAEVGTGYGGEQDGDNPLFTISRSRYYDLTVREVGKLIKAIDMVLTGDAMSVSSAWEILTYAMPKTKVDSNRPHGGKGGRNDNFRKSHSPCDRCDRWGRNPDDGAAVRDCG